jgi:hypothetical protein
LYNMPKPHKASKLPNSIVTYKATFQYLPGSHEPVKRKDTSAARPEVETPAGLVEVEDPRYVVDDVSRFWDIEASTARCPVFVDDLKTTK